MKKAVVLLSAFILLFLSPKLAVAASNQYRFHEVSLVEADEVIEGNFFSSGEKVQVSGNVMGDAYLAGGNIVVDGVIDGDLLAAGGDIRISGIVNQDVRIAGGTVTIDGTINGNVTVASGNVTITDQARIGKGVVAFAGNMDLDAPVAGSVEAFVGNLLLSSNAQVKGDVNYWSEDEANVNQQASISGTLNKQGTGWNMKWKPDVAVREFFQAIGTFATITSLLTTLLLGLLAVKLFPKFMHSGVQILSNDTAKAFGVGFLTLILTPAVIGILFITVIGIPLAVMLTFIVLVSFYLVRLYAMLAIGVMILKRVMPKYVKNDLIAFATGMFAYYLISMIPIVGGIFVILVFIASLGASVINKHKFFTTLTQKELL